MITIEQINGEIAVLEEETPTYVVMQKLADLYTVRDHMSIGEPDTPEVVTEVQDSGQINYDGMSDFAEAINGKNINDVMPIINEMVEAVQILNPRLYNSIMIKIQEI